MLAITETGLAALIAAACSGAAAIIGAIATIIAARNRRELGRTKSLNGSSMRDEIQGTDERLKRIEHSLGEHVRQTEEAIMQIGRRREDVIAWLRKKMEENGDP